jgi:NRAMP (natural resistance-associated macrophage protein)-like metal ion transporter
MEADVAEDRPVAEREEERRDRAIPHRDPVGGTATLVAAQLDAGGPVRRFLKILGPGFITGASDDDPSGIGTYASVGAAFGFAALWLAPATFPLMAAVQYTCAKIGMIAGIGLTGVLRRHYPRWVLYPAVSILVVANTINAGVDIGAIAAGLNLLVPIPITAMIIPITVAILALQLFGSYRLIARVFKWLTLALFAYIGAAFFAHPDWGAVRRGTLLPTVRLDQAFLMALVAILETTISPYLFFWQASEEVEEEVSLGRTKLSQRRGATDRELRLAAWDVDLGMLFSNVVMYFIILATAATLHVAGQTDIGSAAEAAKALEPLAGSAASTLLALGLIGSGFLAVPILTGAGAYAAAEAWGWQYGLNESPRRAKPFYAVIIAATLVGMLIDFVGINPITALYWTAVLNGVLAPPLLVLIMLMANNRAVMGERTNGLGLNILGWATAAAMAAAALGFVVSWL